MSRVDAVAAGLRERFRTPIDRATTIADRTMAWFPVRVWRRFLQHNGFVLAAGVSYQAIFAVFAAIYLAFALVGVGFGADRAAIDGLIELVNGYVPGLIGPGGLVTEQQVAEVALGSAGVLSVTGAIAFVVLVWTAIGFVTYARRAARDLLALPNPRGYVLLKARDLLAAAVFGAALLVGGVLGSAATWALDAILDSLSIEDASTVVNASTRAGSLLVSLAINAGAIAAFIRFIVGVRLPWRVILPGSLAGGAATTVMQIGAGLLLSASPRNPLLATFAFFVGMLLWFRVIGIVLLVATAWVAISANDRDLALRPVSEQERRATEQRALLLAANERVRDAEDELAAARWPRRFGARRRLRDARDELARVAAASADADAALAASQSLTSPST